MRRLALSGAAALILVLMLLSITGVIPLLKTPPAADAETSVRFIDVGQGDCTLAVSEGHALLIDTGETDDSDAVIRYIKSLGISRLDCLILTHPHSDHIGEAGDILESFEVGRLMMPAVPGEGWSYDRLTEAAAKKGLTAEDTRDAVFDAGGFRVEIFGTDEYGSDLNDCSAVVKLTHGKESFLITGDCGKAEEERLLELGKDLRADVLKAGHHGSSGASSERFLEAVRPEYAVISCGRANEHGHPHEETLMRLREHTQDIFITADSGTVTFVCGGERLDVLTERHTARHGAA